MIIKAIANGNAGTKLQCFSINKDKATMCNFETIMFAVEQEQSYQKEPKLLHFVIHAIIRFVFRFQMSIKLEEPLQKAN